MSVSFRHVLSQGAVLRTLGRAALSALPSSKTRSTPTTPGPWLDAVLSPRPAELVHDYLVHVGADPAVYAGYLPPHLFPQWGFPLLARTLEGLPFPLVRAMNAGCSFQVRARLPAHEPLFVRARLLRVEVDERRALLTQELITGTASAPDALSAEVRVFIPLGGRGEKGSDRSREPKAPPVVPAGADEIAALRLAADAGLDFAKLTGDFNPIHWLSPVARLAGLPGCILHGFGTLARAVEASIGAVLHGDPTRLTGVDARFTRPLPLPARVGVFTLPAVGGERPIYVGDAVGGRMYLEGRITERPAETRS